MRTLATIVLAGTLSVGGSSASLGQETPAPTVTDTPKGDPGAHARETAALALVEPLLVRAGRGDPEVLRSVAKSAKAGLARRLRGDSAALANAEAMLAAMMLTAAPDVGAEEYQRIELDPGPVDPEVMASLRFAAASAFMRQKRAEPAYKALKQVYADEKVSRNRRGRALFMLAVMIEDPEKRNKVIEAASMLLKGSPSEPAMHLMRMSRGEKGHAEAILAMKPEPTRAWAAAVTMALCAPDLGAAGQRPDATATLDKALGIFLADENAEERVDDLICFASLCREDAPELAMKAAKEAEQTAVTALTDDTRRRTAARLCVAKLLRLAGKEADLKDYADVDLKQVLVPGWGWDMLNDEGVVATVRIEAAQP